MFIQLKERKVIGKKSEEVKKKMNKGGLQEKIKEVEGGKKCLYIGKKRKENVRK
jgi:hypothetical protein